MIFDSQVRYLPNKTKSQKKKDGRMTYKDKQAKWEAISRVGVFVGYDMKPGYEWSRRYLIWDLDVFQNADLFATTEKCMKAHSTPHKVRRIRFPVGEIQFPLKEQYLKANDTLEGRTAAMQDAPEVAIEVGDRTAGNGGKLFDLVENVGDDDVGAGGEVREEPEHGEDAAETPCDSGRKSVEDAPQPTIGKLEELRALTVGYTEDDFSPEVVRARRKLADATAMHLIAESDVNGYVIQEADVLFVLEQWGFEQNPVGRASCTRARNGSTATPSDLYASETKL